MIDNYERYAGLKNSDAIPIFQRENIHNKNSFSMIAHDYIKKIVNTKVGYYAAKISYKYDDPQQEEDKGIIDKVISKIIKKKNPNDIIQNYLKINSMENIDNDVAVHMTACGYGVKLHYIKDIPGQPKEDALKVQVVDPYECIFISETSDQQYCIRYYPITSIDDKGLLNKSQMKIEFYTSKYIYKFISNDFRLGKGKTPIDPNKYWKDNGVSYHMLAGLPIYKFKNNRLEIPECNDPVMSEIDAQDLLHSRAMDETGELANAFLGLSNLILGSNDEEIKKKYQEMKEIGALLLGADGRAEWIIKNLPTAFYEMLFKRHDEDIYSFASSINYNDPNIGAISGIALKNKLLSLETSCIMSENQFKSSTTEMFRVASAYWKTLGIDIDYRKININMVRNFPLDLEYEARTAQMLKGIVSDKTLLSLMSFIQDPDKEIEQIKKEEAEKGEIDLDKFDENGNPVNKEMTEEEVFNQSQGMDTQGLSK